jgi:DNA-binding GntR family transcriptional regulator
MDTAKDVAANSNTAIAVRELRKLIFDGHLGAGTDHLESELALRLGMSRTPIREALLRLEAQGLVKVRPRKGVRITPVSPIDMAEIYDILTELESLAAANAAERGLSESDLGILSTSILDMQNALNTDDRESWANADDTFHRELVRLGDNARATKIVEMMSDQVRRARLVTLYMRPAPTKSNDDHSRVLNAIRRGDADEARRVHRAHRLAAKDILIDLLQRHRLSSI